MLGHESQPRLGALAFGGVHQRQQDRRPIAVNELARIDRQIDQRAVGPDMLPGARRALVAGPRQFGVEGLQAADRQLLEFAAAVTIMLDRCVVDGENAFVTQRADDHRHRIAVEQQPERGLPLFQLGDIDAQADDAAILGQAFIDQDDAAVGQRLLMPLAGLVQLLEPRGDPFFLAPDGLRIIAARDADADGIFQPRARLEQVRTAAVHLRIFLVPENIAAFGIEKHDALRQDVDRLPQALMRFARLGKGGVDLGVLARDLADCMPAARVGGASPRALPAGRKADNRRLLRFPGCSSLLLRHCYALPRIVRAMFSDKLSEKIVSLVAETGPVRVMRLPENNGVPHALRVSSIDGMGEIAHSRGKIAASVPHAQGMRETLGAHMNIRQRSTGLSPG